MRPADFARLGAEAQAAVDGEATVHHVDTMDGRFVPNLRVGPPVVASLRGYRGLGSVVTL